MHDLIETVGDALSDAARDGCLDLNDPVARREAVAWSLAIIGQVWPELLAEATPQLTVLMPPAVRNDPHAVSEALNEYVLPRATAYLN